MKTKKYFVLLTLLLSSLTGWAQMSDSEVVSYVKTQNAAGKSQKSIAQELVSRGVTQDQLLRLKQQYESESTVTTSNVVGDRGRMANGESIPDEQVECPKVIFGHDVFRSKSLSFQPNMNIATPTTYTLGPGDEVIVDIYGSSQASSKMKVAPDGSVTIPNEGPVNIAGLTVAQAQAKVRGAIGGHYAGSSIKLSVGQTRTILVNVMGEVNTPGTYSLSAFSTVFNALYLAGGITDIGTLRNIKVSRNGRVITTVDVYDFIVNGRLTGNIMLRDNDVIMVGPYENLVRIEGKVKRPMYYEMKKNESLKSLLSFAGGFTGDAYKEKVRVERKSSEGLTVYNVDEWDFSTFHDEDEDLVIVAPIIERYKNKVTVSGAVFRPGDYKIDGSVNSVKTVVEQAGGLLEQAVTSNAVLLRMKPDRTRKAMSIPLNEIMEGTTPDIGLENEDELIISSYSKLVTDRQLTITGEVMTPDTFSYADDVTIRDLITMAGGLTASASLDSIEVARRITSAADNPDGNQKAKIFTINLTPDLHSVGGGDFTLEPYDKVTIHRNPDYKLQQSVLVRGEVRYAGYYTLGSKDEHLSDIIRRAGGLTNKAYTGGAKLVRRYTEDELTDRQQLLEMAQNRKDSVEAIHSMQNTTYKVGIDLVKALESQDSQYDIIIKEGDVITVPEMSDVVKISGDVLSPNTVTYLKEKSASYYLNEAGGVTRTGERSKAYILYANGHVSALSKGKIEPGCEIVVPSKKEKKTDTAKVGMWATLASTMASIGAVVAAIVK